MTGRIIREGPYPPSHPCDVPRYRQFWGHYRSKPERGTQWQCDDCGQIWTWGQGYDMQQWIRDINWGDLPPPPPA